MQCYKLFSNILNNIKIKQNGSLKQDNKNSNEFGCKNTRKIKTNNYSLTDIYLHTKEKKDIDF